MLIFYYALRFAFSASILERRPRICAIMAKLMAFSVSHTGTEPRMSLGTTSVK